MKRCEWATTNPLMQKYHDEEWGTPVYNDDLLFEHFVLDCFQAGLSWQTILNKRENFRKAFDGFDYRKIAKYNNAKYESLLNNAGIIRNRLKIKATISNAQKFMEVQNEFSSFSNYFWSFTNGKTIQNRFNAMRELPATSTVSDAMSKDLKKRGFKFAGSTICYAIMQAVGMVNDHVCSCYRHEQLT